MGSNLSKRRSQSSGNLTGKLPQDKYKLCGSLPNHLDLPADNNNETAATKPPATRVEDLGYGSERSPDDPEPPFPACPVHHAHFLKKYPFINSSILSCVSGLEESCTRRRRRELGDLVLLRLIQILKALNLQGNQINTQAAEAESVDQYELDKIRGDAIDQKTKLGLEYDRKLKNVERELKIFQSKKRRESLLAIHAHQDRLYKDSIFTVMVKKGSGGLGLSVAGGEPWPGLIRIKRLFPHQPASHSGLLSPGDILLAASGVPLLGLTNYEALEVLRSSPPEVKLTACRPPELVVPPVDTVAPPPPPRDPPVPPLHDQYGEFEILMEKVNGSLGFTLRKEDQSVLGHYVRALVREPALSDPRIRPGDKIVAVNDVEMSNLTHEEAVAFLRQCGELVRLRLYRDPAQTPVPSHSPTHSHRTFKPILRKEAQDMLSELAVKKSQSPQESSGSSKGSSPRKRRLTRTPPPAERSDSLESTIEEARLAKVEQSHSMSEKKVSQFSSNLATQSSEEELVATGLSGNEPPPSEPVSMPPMSTLEQETDSGFSYRNPAYRSANQPISKSMTAHEIQDNGCSEQDIPNAIEGTKSLIKWKGVILCGEDGDRSEATISELAHSESMSSQQSQEILECPEYQVVIVELNRGWNSRLGFSLQSAEGGGSVISAIYSDSVASRDGRLRIGDRLINVNDDNIDGMETSDVIDLLRKIRGSISLTLLRKAKRSI